MTGLYRAMFFLLPASLAWAQAPVNRFGPDTEATLADLQPKLADNESYSESWSHGVWNAEGEFLLGVDFVISNLGVGDHKGAVSIDLVGEDGKHRFCKKEYDDDEWRSARDKLRLDFGGNILSGDSGHLHIEVGCDDMRVELEFANSVTARKLGDGQLRFGDDGDYRLVITSPRSRVTGRVTTKAGTRPISGFGYADHSRMTIAPYDMSRRWFRLKSITATESLVVAAMEATEDYGRVLRGWVLWADDSGRHLLTGNTNFEFKSFIRDNRTSEGYVIPRLVSFSGTGAGGRIAATLQMTGLKEVRDPLARLGALKRAFVRRFTKPRDYYISSSMTLSIQLAGQPARQQQKDVVFRFYYVNP